MIRVIYAEAGSKLHDYPMRPESRLVLVYEDGTVSSMLVITSRMKVERISACRSTANTNATG
jgi:hypothetical protein